MLNTNDVLPTVPGVGGIGISEELRKLRRIALEMNLNEAAQFLSNHL
jgi:histidine ammonia-lyase